MGRHRRIGHEERLRRSDDARLLGMELSRLLGEEPEVIRQALVLDLDYYGDGERVAVMHLDRE